MSPNMFRPLENQPPGAGTPNVRVMVAATPSDFNQERLVCMGVFTISGVLVRSCFTLQRASGPALLCAMNNRHYSQSCDAKNGALMKDGLYAVNFKSSSQDFGSGVISVQKGSVNGGDHGYFYQGQIVINDSKLSGTIQIKQWNRNVPSVFGPIPHFDLPLEGQSEGDNFELQGSVAGQTIRIVGRYLAGLV